MHKRLVIEGPLMSDYPFLPFPCEFCQSSFASDRIRRIHLIANHFEQRMAQLIAERETPLKPDPSTGPPPWSLPDFTKDSACASKGTPKPIPENGQNQPEYVSFWAFRAHPPKPSNHWCVLAPDKTMPSFCKVPNSNRTPIDQSFLESPPPLLVDWSFNCTPSPRRTLLQTPFSLSQNAQDIRQNDGRDSIGYRSSTTMQRPFAEDWSNINFGEYDYGDIENRRFGGGKLISKNSLPKTYRRSSCKSFFGSPRARPNRRSSSNALKLINKYKLINERVRNSPATGRTMKNSASSIVAKHRKERRDALVPYYRMPGGGLCDLDEVVMYQHRGTDDLLTNLTCKSTKLFRQFNLYHVDPSRYLDRNQPRFAHRPRRYFDPFYFRTAIELPFQAPYDHPLSIRFYVPMATYVRRAQRFDQRLVLLQTEFVHNVQNLIHLLTVQSLAGELPIVKPNENDSVIEVNEHSEFLLKCYNYRVERWNA